MNKYNPNIHHRRSIRLKGYDYSQAGLYFITICCQDRACLFGEIVVSNGLRPEMKLNEMGIIAQNEWLKTPSIRQNVELGNFVVMPNHLHGIIILTELDRGESHSPQQSSNNDGNGESHSPQQSSNNDGNGESHSPQQSSNNGGNGESHSPQQSSNNGGNGESHSPQQSSNNGGNGESHSFLRGPSNNIGAIIRGYKSSVTKNIRLLDDHIVVWQRNYHEHIIKNEKSYHNISNYIVNNPANWNGDKFHR